MFFDAAGAARTFGLPLADAARALQDRILKEVGVPVTVGVSLTKALAKLAAESCKPFALPRPDRPRRGPAIPGGDAGGRGRRASAAAARKSWRDTACGRAGTSPRRGGRSSQLLTIRGEKLWWELNGTPASPVQAERPAHKALTRGGSLGVATADPLRLTAWAVRNAERLVEALDHHRLHAGRLALHVSFRGGGGWGGSLLLDEPTAPFDLIAGAVKQLLGRVVVSQPVSRMHLWADRLSGRRVVQGVLFPEPNPAAERAAAAKRHVNGRTGRFAARSGETLPLGDVYGDAAQNYDICDIHGKHCF